jgi:CRISPR-associated endonuclease/helicase Cas3
MVFGNRSNLFNYWGQVKSLKRSAPCYHPLVYHSLDVAAVGFQLLNKRSLISKKSSRFVWADSRRAVGHRS